MAISSPLLEVPVDGAKGVIVNVTGSMDMDLEEVTAATDMIREVADPDALFIFGAAFDEELEDELVITVIATGFDGASASGGVSANPYSAGKAKAEGEAPETEAKTEESDFDAVLKIFTRGN